MKAEANVTPEVAADTKSAIEVSSKQNRLKGPARMVPEFKERQRLPVLTTLGPPTAGLGSFLSHVNYEN